MASVAEFADVARRYCEWVENPPVPNDALVVHRLLAELQLTALSLPSAEGDDEFADIQTKDNNLETVIARIHTLPVNFYWKIFDVFTDDEEAVGCTMMDDLSDIYSDLKEGLYFFENGNVNEAVWRWRFSYFTHWGRHLTGAQTALHQYLADYLV